ELRLLDLEEHGRTDGGDRRRAPRAAEDRQLAEVCARRVEPRQLEDLSVVDRSLDLAHAVDQHEQRVAVLALLDDLVAVEPSPEERAPDEIFEPRSRDVTQERDGSENVRGHRG